MSGSTTALDSTAGGTAALSSSSYAGIGPSYRGYSFTTGSGSPTWEISGIRLAMKLSSGSGSYSVTVGLYATSGNVPTGTALASATVSLSLTSSSAYQYLDTTALGAVATYAMASGTGYAIAVTSSSVLRWSYLNAGSTTSPGTAEGFGLLASIASSNGTSWGTTVNSPAFQLDVQATCFLRGTLILTRRGEVAVETLRAGDLVATKFGGLRPVRWIGTQRFEGRLAGKGHQPIRFAPGSLGHGMPSCDLRVSPGHAMLVQDGQGGEVLAHAGALVNGSTITQEQVRGGIEYFHIDLGPHDCVLANGAWAESYFEDRNRDSFHNAAAFHALHPGHVAERQASCLPIVTAEHPAINGLRAMLAPAGLRTAA